MLLFLALIDAFFLADTAHKTFMTVGSNTVTMGPGELATDFRTLAGKNPVMSLILQDPVSAQVLDQSGGGNNLISWGMHGQSNQCFRLVLAADNSLYLTSGTRCLKYVASSKSFVRGDCNNEPTPFDILYELSYKKERETRGLFEPKPRNSRHHMNMRFRPYELTQSGFHLRRHHNPRLERMYGRY